MAMPSRSPRCNTQEGAAHRLVEAQYKKKTNDMTKLKSNFLNKYRVNSPAQVALDIYQWCEDIKNGNDTSVRLTDFVTNLCNPKQKDSGIQPYVIKVQGYQIISIERSYVRPIAIYSPLIKKLVGYHNLFAGFLNGVEHIPTHRADTHAAIYDVGIDPLDDDMTKRLMFAGYATSSFYFSGLCLNRRGANSNYFTQRLCREMDIDDPLRAMVHMINSLPTEERKRILDIYDTYGPIDSLVGDALIHIDKFRSF